jgi:phosphodiesterase/alkaline phosphatase D-like protein
MSSPSILLGPIVGGLSQSSANIWARADAPSTLHVWLAKDPELKDAKRIGEVELTEQDGHAGVLPLTGLQPETQYFYAVSLQMGRPATADFHSFTTFPEESTRRSFSFTFGSCFLPLAVDVDQTFDEIYRHIESDHLRFGLFIGDQVYADRPRKNGLGKIAVTLEDYRSIYAYAWSRPSFRRLLPALPLFMILDDHEVDDDWRWDSIERNSSSIPPYSSFIRQLKGIPSEQRKLPLDRIRAALRAYYEHQVMHAPEMLLPLQTDNKGEFTFHQGDEGSFAYTFNYGGTAFFVLDTRTLRVKKGKNILLGEAQWKKLEAWFLEVKDRYPVKFLVSSGTVLHPFLMDIVRDRWSGFPADRKRLFKFLAENEIEGVRILTGDIHSAHAVSAEIKCPNGRRIPIWEFCSTPFEQKSKWASATYFPILFSKWIRGQKKLFRQTGNNFGIVHVDFDNPTPRVSFTLHYNKDGWKSLPQVHT